MKMRHCVLSVMVATGLTLYASAARAQYFMSYTGDAASREIRDAISLVAEAEQAIDTNHRVLSRWLLMAAADMIQNVHTDLPNARFRTELAHVRGHLKKDGAARALSSAGAADGELQSLMKVWETGDAREKMKALISHVEKGDVQAAMQGTEALLTLVRVDPLQKCLENAASRVEEARARHDAGYDMEALNALAGAGHSLRRAYLASKLTQVKIFVAYAGRMAERGSWGRARVTLWRAARKLRKGSYMVDSAEADAVTKIAVDLDSARGMLRKNDREGVEKLKEVEVKLVALLAKITP